VAFGSISMAVLLGLLASLYPALHASKMDPTEALRAL
jgi:putative ABC transport system permease protein